MGAMPVEEGAHRYFRWIDKRVMLIPGVVQFINNLPAVPP